jgi:hypothetical protein
MSTNYDFDEAAASRSDDVANRIDQCGAFIGTFKKVNAFLSSKGTEGIHFEFDVPGGGAASFDCYTRKMDENGNPKTLFGLNQVQAMMAILKVRGLQSKPGKVEVWEDGKKVEADGDVFPDLEGKRIGLVLQKELYDKNNGEDGFRMNLFGVFDAESRLTASEIKERKAQPEKLERMLRGLKVKDSRKAKIAEPAQPSLNVGAGDY